mmetsp:Transcript_83136/g.217101  ORF Transcript_83136/g.217101 Transcript_83136/m.217101 type:complete len:220 (-) Transcript_83136:116-775(-)
MSIGRYTKSYVPAKPFELISSRSPCCVSFFGRFRIICVTVSAPSAGLPSSPAAAAAPAHGSAAAEKCTGNCIRPGTTQPCCHAHRSAAAPSWPSSAALAQMLTGGSSPSVLCMSDLLQPISDCWSSRSSSGVSYPVSLPSESITEEVSDEPTFLELCRRGELGKDCVLRSPMRPGAVAFRCQIDSAPLTSSSSSRSMNVFFTLKGMVVTRWQSGVGTGR